MTYPFGINLIGSESQLGQRLHLLLRETGIPVSCLTLSTKEYPYRINIIVLDPLDTPKIEELYSDIFKDRYTIGVWDCELDKYLRALPPKKVMDLYHEIWTVSEFSRKAIQDVVSRPVKVVRLPIIPRLVKYDTHTKFTVLFMFSYLSGIARKNPHLVIDAFVNAFGDDESVQLVLRTTDGDKTPLYVNTIKQKIGNRKNIIHIDGDMSEDEKWDLIEKADVCISLHSSGGLEFFPLEGMAMGKAVMATGYSGTTDFMNDENSVVIPYEMVDIPSYCHIYGKYKHKWAHPNTDVVVAYLKALRDDEYRKELGDKARRYIEEECCIKRCVSILKDLISQIPTTIPQYNTWKVLQDRLGKYDDVTTTIPIENGYAHIRDPVSTTIIHHSTLPTPIIVPKGFSISFKI